MTFNSLAYIGFFAIVASINFLIPGRVRWLWLVLASMVFYAWSGPVYLLQIVAATMASHVAALRIEATEDKERRHRILVAIILLLVANLFAFKYVSFVNETLRSIVGLAGAHYPVGVAHIIAPIGISFYTFQLIGYLVDVSRGTKAERHVGLFMLYVLLFPKLVAGPIERAKNLLPQLQSIPGFDYVRVVGGLQLVAWGAFKKVVIADRIAPLVGNVFDHPHAHEGVSMVFATFLYAFQLYCDFSGYTDMALGAAAILGFKLMQNFNHPYFATSIPDFWKRWHISLTSWLTDYVYTPMTRTKRIKMKWYNLMLLSLFLTFVTSGLWHGAQWTFVAWGALHGTYMIAATQLQKPWNKLARQTGLNKRPVLHRRIKIASTFTFVCIAYVLFRASSLADALYIYSHLHTGWSNAPHILVETFPIFQTGLLMLGIFIVILAENLQLRGDTLARVQASPVARWTLYYAGAVSIITLGAYYDASHQFIYFRF